MTVDSKRAIVRELRPLLRCLLEQAGLTDFGNVIKGDWIVQRAVRIRDALEDDIDARASLVREVGDAVVERQTREVLRRQEDARRTAEREGEPRRT